MRTKMLGIVFGFFTVGFGAGIAGLTPTASAARPGEALGITRPGLPGAKGDKCPGAPEPLCVGCSPVKGCIDACNGTSYCNCDKKGDPPRGCRTSPPPSLLPGNGWGW
jgi:hypothetical protein